MATLTRDEARTRARLLDIHQYTIALDFTRGETVFGSRTTVGFTARHEGDTFIELRPTTLHRAVLDGRDLAPADLADGRLPLPGLTAGEHELHLEADMPYSRTGEGMHRFTDPADGLTYLYSMCCMTEGPLVYAAFDQPDLKATFSVSVTAPEGWTVLGNGIATETEGRPGHWKCATTPPLSTYLMAVAAGPWHSVRTEHAGLPFGLHVRRSLAEHLDHDADEILDITRRCFDRYHEIFDEPYPFDSYDQAFVPEFNAGAMENPGLVTFRDEFIHRSAVTDTQRQVRGMVIAHEMAHMWFGDLVTLQWWDDIWLNESFAEYMGYQVLTEATGFQPWTEFSVSRKAWGYDADQRPSTHPVAPAADAVPDTASAWLNFDGISYAKGASALRQLVTWLGEEAFLAGINDHFARHRFGNATLADFIDSLGRASADRDVHAWADQWLRTSGPDTLTPELRTADGEWELHLTHTGGRPHRIGVGVYDRAPSDPDTAVLRERPELDVPAGEGTSTYLFDGSRPDLLVLNDGDLSYAKVRLDARSWDTAQHVLGSLPEPQSRAVVWNAARDMVRDTELDPLGYLQAARRHLPAETDNAILEGVLGFCRSQIADRYLNDRERDDALATLTGLARVLLERTDDGEHPTLRLTAVRCLISSATAPFELRGWWDAGTVPGGPELDPELRWRLLLRLAVLGDASEDDIRAEAERDPGSTGQEGAARCRAALPDAAVKAAVWEDMFGKGSELSNYLFIASAQGFWQPEQRTLLEPYQQRYFPAAVDLAARRGHALTEAACRHAFPRATVDSATLRAGEDCLAREDLTPTLRRGLTDQLDDLRRALRIHEATDLGTAGS
ncbi:aminopeptidase N [Streptomyces sp. ACA25]|uniref:aminopeptidase N n=1 Tax=Streptomyces sp. ACA25 TaxID=3022596 RepID=UPI002307408A|nr:aminopeptidase N [Streptomyces sp. ACA25]MDB1088595.1 aminopeptidase N [Streptomyces sp. ACA25]